MPLAIEKPKMSSLTSSTLTVAMVLVLLILIFPFNKVYGDEQQDSCSRRCGVHNISHPFRLKDSPKKCGNKRYTLSCEDNNQLILCYEFKKFYFLTGEFRKYYVQSINYNNFTIRLLDFSLGYSNYSRPPDYSFGVYNLSYFLSSPYQFYQYKNHSKNILTKSLLHVSCPNKAATGNCMNSTLYSQYRNSFYVDGYKKSLSDLRLRDTCHIEFVYLTSWNVEDNDDKNNISCMGVRRMIFYGFELSWINSHCIDGWYVNNHGHCVLEGNLLHINIKNG
jgi:interleukin-1 receptor-associated kinase 1